MTKKEIFDEILKESAFVCSVEPKDIIDGNKAIDVTTARYIAIFWAEAAGFSVASLTHCMDKNNATALTLSVRSRKNSGRKGSHITCSLRKWAKDY